MSGPRSHPATRRRCTPAKCQNQLSTLPAQQTSRGPARALLLSLQALLEASQGAKAAWVRRAGKLAGAAGALTGLTLAAVAPASAEARYRNAEYGLSAGLPAGSNVCGPVAPQPNHGVLLRPMGVTSPPCEGDIESGERYTAVDAHYAPPKEPEDVEAWASEACPQIAYDSQGRVSAIAPAARPGHLFWAACRIDGADGSVFEVMFARRRRPSPQPDVDYTVTFKTTKRFYAADHASFVRWLHSVRFTRPL